MRIPPSSPFDHRAQTRSSGVHEDAIEEVSPVEAARFRKQKQQESRIDASETPGLPTLREAPSPRQAGFGRCRHSVPFLAQLISQTHWSRPRRAAMLAPEEASSAYRSADEDLPPEGPAAFNRRVSRII